MYGTKRAAYLSKFHPSQLYRAFWDLEGLVLTPQGTGSQMRVFLHTQLCNVELQNMLEIVLTVQRDRFMLRKTAALQCYSPSDLSFKSTWRSSFRKQGLSSLPVYLWKEQTWWKSKWQASLMHPSPFGSCYLPHRHNPIRVAYIILRELCPCWHRVYFLYEKHGPVKFLKFEQVRHLTSAWCLQY